MKVEEALEKQIIVDVDIETKESAIKALIETCIRNDELWKATREYKRDLESMKHLAEDIRVLIRYDSTGGTEGIPITALIDGIGRLTTKLEKI